jgi:tape measure domain-containing protein
MGVDIGTGVNFDIGPALAALDKLGGAEASLTSEFLKSNAAITQSFVPITASIGDIVIESRAASAAQRQFAGDIAGLVKEIRDQAAAQREAQRAAAAAADERRKATAEARAAAKAEKAAAKEAADAAKEVAAAERLRAKEAAAANRESQKSGGILGGLGKVLGSLQGQVAAAFGLAAIKAFFNEVRENALVTESTLGKLTFANGGDVQAAARDYAFVRSQVDRLGLDLNTAGKSYGSFTAAAEAANFPLAEARKLFLATAGASTVLKLSADDTQGVLLAFTQILSKGNVQAEELRGQIGERLPGAFAIAARSMGVTEQQLNKLLQTGQVKATDFLPKFAEELQKTFGDGTAQAFDSAIANQNRFENEYNAFLLRFQGATATATAKAAEYFRRFNEGLDLKSINGRERLGEKAAQPGIQAYEAVLNGLVTQAEKDAKTAGENIAFRISYVLAEQRNLLDRQREEAVKALAFFDTNTKQGNENAGNFQGGLVAFRQAEVVARSRVRLLDGEIAKLGEVAEARKKADSPVELEGLIKKQEDLIKALKVRQKAATQENQGGGADFLLGSGGLDEQLKAAEKELDRLLGKIDKTAKAAADKLAAALRALDTARVELATKAAQAAIKESDDASERAKLAFEEALRQADLAEKRLQALELKVRKLGGRGEKGDGVIDGVQAQQLSIVRLAALDKYYTDLYAITKAREQRLFDLRADSDAKEIEAIDRKYDALIKRTTDNIERQALEEARQREQLALKAAQEQKRIDQTAALGTATAQAVGEVYGSGTGISVFEAKRAEQRAILEIEKQAAQDSLNNTLNKTGKEAEIEREALRGQLSRIKHQQDALSIQETLGKFSIYKLILGENDNDETRVALDKVAGTVVDGLQQITAAEEQAAADRVSVSNQVINELNGQLAAQIQLNAQGSASNIKGLQDQIVAEKQTRREALEDQRKTAKEKVLIDTLTQASSITTAAAEVFATFAALGPFGVVAGIAAATVLVGAFVAAKAQAYAAAGNTGSGFYKGGYTGGTDEREERGVVHGKEFVHTAEKTVKYRTLFEALHTDSPEKIDWSSKYMQALLPRPEVHLLPDVELPDKLRAERAQNLRVQHEHSFAPMQSQFDRMHDRLEAIEKSNSRMADRPERLPLGNGKIVEITENGSTHVKDLAPTPKNTPLGVPLPVLAPDLALLRFKLVYAQVPRLAYPLASGELKLTTEPGENQPEAGAFYYRTKFSGGPLVFTGGDFHLLWAIENSSARCEPLGLLVEHRGHPGIAWADCETWTGSFTCNDCTDWNAVTCTVSLSPELADPYQKLLDNWESEFNILLTPGARLSVSAQLGTLAEGTDIEFKRIDQDKQADYIGDEAEQWALFYTNESYIYIDRVLGFASGFQKSPDAVLFRYRQRGVKTLPGGQPYDRSGSGWVALTADPSYQPTLGVVDYVKAPAIAGFRPYKLTGSGSVTPFLHTAQLGNTAPGLYTYGTGQFLTLDCGKTPADVGLVNGDWVRVTGPDGYGANSAESPGGSCLNVREQRSDKNYHAIYWRFGNFTFSRGFRFIDGLYFLLQQTTLAYGNTSLLPPTAEQLSTFLTAAVNPATSESGLGNEIPRLQLSAGSDVKRFGASEPATRLLISLKQFLGDSGAFWDAGWFVDPATGWLRFEDRSYVERKLAAGLEIDLATNLEEVLLSNSYSYRTQSLPRYEGLTITNANTEDALRDAYFGKSSIDYGQGACVNGKAGSNRVDVTSARLTGDVTAAVLNGETIPDNTLFVLAPDPDGRLTQANRQLAANQLQLRYWRRGRVFGSATVEGPAPEVEANTVVVVLPPYGTPLNILSVRPQREQAAISGRLERLSTLAADNRYLTNLGSGGQLAKSELVLSGLDARKVTVTVWLNSPDNTALPPEPYSKAFSRGFDGGYH